MTQTINRRGLLCFLFILFAIAPAAFSEEARTSGWPSEITWIPQFVGIEYANVSLEEPRPLQLHVLTIDLGAEGVSVCTNVDNGELPEETQGLRTSSFLLKKGCQAAINGAPFWPGRGEENLGQNVVGLTVSDGELVSPVDQDKPRSALVFRNTVATIETPPIDLADIDHAVGGFGVVLRKGKLFRDVSTPLDVLDGVHPRTAVAIADAGKTLLLVVVDGRQPGYSEGVTLEELGELLMSLGAVDGLNMDGGGTSTMVVEGLREGSANPPLQLNRPINGGVVGIERVAASHLGIYAKPLSGDFKRRQEASVEDNFE